MSLEEILKEIKEAWKETKDHFDIEADLDVIIKDDGEKFTRKRVVF